MRSRFKHLEDELDWYGKVAGTRLPAGTYHLALVAVDPAGNRSRPVQAGLIEIRGAQ